MENFVNVLNAPAPDPGEKKALKTADDSEVVAGFATLFINQMETEIPVVEQSVVQGAEIPEEGADAETTHAAVTVPSFGKFQSLEMLAESKSTLDHAPVALQQQQNPLSLPSQDQLPVSVPESGSLQPLEMPVAEPGVAPQKVPKPGKFQPLEVSFKPETALVGSENIEGEGAKDVPVLEQALTTLADAVPLRQLVRGDKRLSPKLQAIASDLLAVRTENGADATMSRAPTAVAESMPLASTVSEQAIRLEALADRFDQRVLSMVHRDEKVMKISLKPAALGRLTVICREEGAGLSVEIHAQSNVVRELLAQQEDAVRRLMQDHDVELDSFSALLDENGGEDYRQFQQEQMPEPQSESDGIRPALNKEGNSHTVRFAARNGAVSWIA